MFFWANGMEGGHVHGRGTVRVDQAVGRPRCARRPLAFAGDAADEVVVEVHQVVHDRQRKLLVDQIVGHIFRAENKLVQRFDIRSA